MTDFKTMQLTINLMIFQLCLRFARSLDQESLDITPTLSPEAFKSYYIRQVLCQSTACRKCEKAMVVQFYKRDRQQKVSSKSRSTSLKSIHKSFSFKLCETLSIKNCCRNTPHYNSRSIFK